VRERFGPTIEAAIAGRLPAGWAASPLAAIVVLDQLTRNAYRDTPKSYAGDRRGLALARRLVDDGGLERLHPIERAFVAMPFEHAESLPMQDEALRLMTAIAAAGHPQGDELIDYARRHRAIVERFGRFPHRNLVLGRCSSAEEIEFLSQPGSRF
jgi:uncharacterized protein (DUF924 family)